MLQEEHQHSGSESRSTVETHSKKKYPTTTTAINSTDNQSVSANTTKNEPEQVRIHYNFIDQVALCIQAILHLKALNMSMSMPVLNQFHDVVSFS